MHLGRVTLAIVLLSTAGGSFASGSPSVRTASRQPEPEQCLVTVRGREQPYRIPRHQAWQATFVRLAERSPSTLDLGLSDASRERLSTMAVRALEYIRASGRVPAPPPAEAGRRRTSRARDLVAVAVQEARDDMLRELPEREGRELMTYANEVSNALAATLQLPGRFVRNHDGSRQCEIEMSGRTHPHLLPEHEVWRSLFRIWSFAVDHHMETHGHISDDYLTLLRRSMFDGMSNEDIRTLLLISKPTATAIEAMTSAPRDATYDTALFNVVMSSRLTLLRSIPRDGWQSLVRHVEDFFSGGMTFWVRGPIDSP